jgi:hypothetical protein
MFRAIGRLFKSVIYFITGKTDAAADKLGQNANVVKASYDEIIRDKKNRIQEYQKAVAGLIAHQEKKMATVRALTKETEKLEQLKAGAPTMTSARPWTRNKRESRNSRKTSPRTEPASASTR